MWVALVDPDVAGVEERRVTIARDLLLAETLVERLRNQGTPFVPPLSRISIPTPTTRRQGFGCVVAASTQRVVALFVGVAVCRGESVDGVVEMVRIEHTDKPSIETVRRSASSRMYAIVG
jgi:hypothetical protein